MVRDMSQVPLNYRPAIQYTGRISDLLYAPGYQGLQNDMVKLERDKLQRQYDVATSPEAHQLFALSERDRLQRMSEQEAQQRRADMERRMLQQSQQSQQLAQWNAQSTAAARPMMASGGWAPRPGTRPDGTYIPSQIGGQFGRF